MATVTVVVAPGSSVPEAGDSVSQAPVAVAVHASAEPPAFSNVYAAVAGSKGPPSSPSATKPTDGVTARRGAPAWVTVTSTAGIAASAAVTRIVPVLGA